MEESQKIRTFNSTFKGANPTSLNACVGENGIQNTQTYAEGYRDAAKLLLDDVVRKNQHTNDTSDINTLIFPIVFCMRHAVELQLKDAISTLNDLRPNHNVQNYKISGSHDIGLIWKFFRKESMKTDRRYEPLNAKLATYVSDIAEIDPTGQTFRYPHDISEDKHLTQTPIINLRNLKIRFESLQILLIELDNLNNLLIEEYSQGTHTQELSRHDLLHIAKELPDRHLWGSKSDNFVTIKRSIRDHYGISNGKFSKAGYLIEHHYEFSKLIGIESPLNYAKEEDFVIFFEISNKLHTDEKSNKDSLGTDYFSRFDTDAGIQQIIEYSDLSALCTQECIDKISQHSMADIATIFELGRKHTYCEYYQKHLKNIEEEFTSYSSNTEDYSRKVGHILEKTNAKEAILNGLEILGQETIISCLS